jgi:hypothetical protein
MTIKKPKWYNRWWVRILFVTTIIISLYFGLRQTVTYFNYREYQKTVIDSLHKQSIYKDTIIANQKKEIQKIRDARGKISTKPEEDRIKIIDHQIKELEKKEIVIDSLSPAELDKWLRKFLKN